MFFYVIDIGAVVLWCRVKFYYAFACILRDVNAGQ